MNVRARLYNETGQSDEYQETQYLLLLGDGNFKFAGSGTGNGLYSDAKLYMGGSATLSAEGGLKGTERTAAIDAAVLFLFENAKIDSAEGSIVSGKEFMVLENASIAEVNEVTDFTHLRIKVEPPGYYMVMAAEAMFSTNPAGWGEVWMQTDSLSDFQNFDPNNVQGKGIQAWLPGQEDAVVSIDSLTPQNNGEYFLLGFSMTSEVQKKVLSIQYENGSESGAVAGKSKGIGATTRNIPEGTYTIELSRAPEGVSLVSVDISPKTAEIVNNVVYYGSSVTEAALTLSISIPEDLPSGKHDLSFSMKKGPPPELKSTTEPDYNEEKFFDNVGREVSSTLWLPTFTLVVGGEPPVPGPGPAPAPLPEPVSPGDLPLPPPPETPAGIAGVSVTTGDGVTLEAQKQPGGTCLVCCPPARISAA
jgi:hypothetical protein